jgi:hypothetical protein
MAKKHRKAQEAQSLFSTIVEKCIRLAVLIKIILEILS